MNERTSRTRADLAAMDLDALVAAITPADSVKTADENRADARTVRLSTADVSAGDIAPDFDLPVHDFSSGARAETSDSFHLQSVAANTPVALVFGSYT